MCNFQLMFGLMVMGFLSFLAVSAANAQTVQCGVNNGDVQAVLIERYEETLINQQDTPDGRAELWANEDTGTYTILFFPAGQGEAVVCIVGSGQYDALIDRSQPA